MSPEELKKYWKDRVSEAKHGIEEEVTEGVKKKVKKKAEEAAPYAAGAAVGFLLATLAIKSSRG